MNENLDVRSSILEALRWRQAAKMFHAEKLLSDQEVQPILESIHLAPSSYGLQPFVVYVITDPDIKKALRRAAYGQPQVESASHMLVFVANKDISENTHKLLTDLRQRQIELKHIRTLRRNIVLGEWIRRLSRTRFSWAAEQAYLALGIALLTAAQLQIEACPMGGFSAKKVAGVLKLSRNLRPVALLALGHRAADAVPRPKYRLPFQEIILGFP